MHFPFPVYFLCICTYLDGNKYTTSPPLSSSAAHSKSSSAELTDFQKKYQQDLLKYYEDYYRQHGVSVPEEIKQQVYEAAVKAAPSGGNERGEEERHPKRSRSSSRGRRRSRSRSRSRGRREHIRKRSPSPSPSRSRSHSRQPESKHSSVPSPRHEQPRKNSASTSTKPVRPTIRQPYESDDLHSTQYHYHREQETDYRHSERQITRAPSSSSSHRHHGRS